MTQLDKSNRKILFELDKNSRAPYAAIAKATGMPAETVRYRVRQLREDGVVRKFYTVVNLGAFGHVVYKVFLKLHSANENKVQQIVEYLVNSDSVIWVARFDGAYDLAVAVRVEQIVTLSSFVDLLVGKYNQYIAKRSFAVNIHSQYLSRDYLLNQKRKGKRKAQYAAPQEALTLDAIDKEILTQLGIDSRITAADIAEHLGNSKKVNLPLSREAVSQRIKKLEKNGIITSYTIMLDPAAAYSGLQYKVLLYLNPTSPEQTEAFLEHLKQHPRISYLIKALSEWDYELTAEVDSVADFREMMVEITGKHPGVVRDHLWMICTEVSKFQLVAGIH